MARRISATDPASPATNCTPGIRCRSHRAMPVTAQPAAANASAAARPLCPFTPRMTTLPLAILASLLGLPDAKHGQFTNEGKSGRIARLLFTIEYGWHRSGLGPVEE